MSRVLLDGSKMAEKTFYKRFKEIVGCTWEAWRKKASTKSSSGSDWYEDKDGKFTFGGTAYEPPKLFKN